MGLSVPELNPLEKALLCTHGQQRTSTQGPKLPAKESSRLDPGQPGTSRDWAESPGRGSLPGPAPDHLLQPSSGVHHGRGCGAVASLQVQRGSQHRGELLPAAPGSFTGARGERAGGGGVRRPGLRSRHEHAPRSGHSQAHAHVHALPSPPAGGLRPPRVLGLGIAVAVVAAVAEGAVVSPRPSSDSGWGGCTSPPRSDVNGLGPPAWEVAAGSLGPAGPQEAPRLRAPSRPFLRGPRPPSVLPTAFSVPPACGAPVAPRWAPATGGTRQGLQTRQR
ncbi:unnamed protein product [Rangifer tarandus platyrhynchus]|uniref:Uncharacterized protein n=1 Tax=Rangifer tarandus platyrhynchus TaxID=3082113 RepID=A0ABN8YA36_RANTA|nr:unnamed protein product [Rangifer tarandus platyrhynchus]